MADPTRSSTLSSLSLHSREAFSLSTLRQVPLFKGVSADDLNGIKTVIKRRSLASNELLLSEDDTDNTLFLVMEGAFKITVRKSEGTVVLGLCGRGELLGELSAIDGHARSATVTAHTPCVLGVVSADDFWQTLWPVAPIPINMSHLLTGRVRRLTAKVQAMATLEVRGRLAFEMVSLTRDHGDPQPGRSYAIPFGLTQAELAQMVGTSRVQVNQLMTTWARHGILTAKRASITIHRLDALCQMFPASLDAIVPKSSRELN